MKRRELIRHLEAHACTLNQEGGDHPRYWNPESGKIQAGPADADGVFITVRKICYRLSTTAP